MDNKNFETSDLSLAAYLVMNGLALVKASKAVNGKFEFELEDPEGKAMQLQLEYINSDFCKFDNQVRTLKKMLYKN